MAAKKAIFPATIYVYRIEERESEWFLAVAKSIDAIPEDQDGEPIATYGLTRQGRLKVMRALK